MCSSVPSCASAAGASVASRPQVGQRPGSRMVSKRSHVWATTSAATSGVWRCASREKHRWFRWRRANWARRLVLTRAVSGTKCYTEKATEARHRPEKDNRCANRKKHCGPSATNHTPMRHTHAKDKVILQMATPQAASSQRTHVSRAQGRSRTHPVNRRVTTQWWFLRWQQRRLHRRGLRPGGRRPLA